MNKTFTKFALSLTAALGLAGIASAQPLHLQPGSALVFPLFDSQAQTATVLNVTNTNEDRTVQTNGFRAGDILLHYVYYGKQADGSTVCLEFDRFELLTPADTLTVLASDHNPEGEVGFLTITSQDPESGDAEENFDFLIGSAYVANSAIDIMWSYTPYSFLGGANNNDGVLDFDGTEYSTFPDTLFIDSFFEEDDGVFNNKLTLMSTSGQDFINELDVFTYNNKEDRFSRTFKFVCHTTVELSEITTVARSLNGDPNEFAKETGWVRIEGRNILDLSGNLVAADPALLAVFVQIVRVDFTAGHALHYTGSQATELPVQP